MSRGRALGPGRLHKQRGAWHLHWTDEHRKRRRKKLATDKRTAEQIRVEIIRRRDLALAGLGDFAGQELLLGDVVDQYLADLEPRVTPEHFKNVGSRLRLVAVALGDIEVGQVRKADVIRVRQEAVASGLSNRTANLRTDRLRACLRWAVDQELIAKNPIGKLPRLPEDAEHQRYRRRAMTDEEIDGFLAAARADDEENDLRMALEGMVRVPQLPLWLALLETGGRWNEIRLATWGDIDLSRGVLVLRALNTKSRKQRAIPLRKGLVERLRALRVLHEEVLRRLPNVGDRIFLSPEGSPWLRYTTNAMRIFDRLLLRAGIPKVDVERQKLDLHALRHTAATRIARGGAGLNQLRLILGHSDPKLTAAVYSHLGVEDLRSAVEGMSGCSSPTPGGRAADHENTGSLRARKP